MRIKDSFMTWGVDMCRASPIQITSLMLYKYSIFGGHTLLLNFLAHL